MFTQHLEYLLVIEQCGSLSKASTHLLISQQRLSQILTDFEDEFKTKIFHRTSKGVDVTPEGKILLLKISFILSEINKLKKDKLTSGNSLCGELNIYKFPDIAAEYFASFTENIINKYRYLSLHITEASFQMTINALQENKCHVGIVLLCDELVNSLPENISFMPALTRTMVAYVNSNNPFAKTNKTTSLKTLIEFPIVLYGYSHEETLLNSHFQDIFKPDVKITVNNLKIFFDYINDKQYVSIGSIPKKHSQSITNITAIPIRDKINIQQGLLVEKSHKDDPNISAFTEAYFDFYKFYG